jgi:hypothetical protein
MWLEQFLNSLFWVVFVVLVLKVTLNVLFPFLLSGKSRQHGISYCFWLEWCLLVLAAICSYGLTVPPLGSAATLILRGSVVVVLSYFILFGGLLLRSVIGK